MKTSKYIAIAASIFALLLAGCGEEKPQAKPQTTPQAAPAKQIEKSADKQVLSKGKIVGTTTVLENGQRKVIQVEERVVKKMGVTGQYVTKKEYYDAADGKPISYDPERDNKDVTIKNKGQQVDTFKSH